jgi:hypothetical protein
MHQQAGTEQKACVWQLTKARHSKGRRGALVAGILQGGDLREDLYARKVLKLEAGTDEPALSNEDEDKNSGDDDKASSSVPLEQLPSTSHFVLVDTLDEHQKQQEHYENRREDGGSVIDGEYEVKDDHDKKS